MSVACFVQDFDGFYELDGDVEDNDAVDWVLDFEEFLEGVWEAVHDTITV